MTIDDAEDAEDFHTLFWKAPVNTEALLDGIEAYKSAKGLETPALVDELKGNWISGAVSLQDGALKRFANGVTQRPHNKKGVSELLLTLCALAELHNETATQKAGAAEFKTLFALRTRYQKRMPKPPEIEPQEKEKTEEPTRQEPVPAEIAAPRGGELSAEDWQVFFGALARMLNVDRRQLLDAWKTFFTQEDVDSVTCRPDTYFNKFYDLYRPLSTGGCTVKSFIEINLVGYPFGHACYFTNYYCHERVPSGVSVDSSRFMRVSKGLVIPMPPMLYLIGEIQGGTGLKILALSDPRVPQPSLKGLLVSFEENRPIAARCAMRMSDATTAQDAGIGIFQDKDIEAELGGDLWSYLKEPAGPALTIF